MAKKYIPNEKEKYMCEKHKKFFKEKLTNWKNEIIESNAKGLYLNEVDRERFTCPYRIPKKASGDNSTNIAC